MVRRVCVAGSIALSLSGCSEAAPTRPRAYASCNDALPAAIHAEASGSAADVKLHGRTFYWLSRTSDGTTSIKAFTVGSEPKSIVTISSGIQSFFIEGDAIVLIDGASTVWRAPLDGSSAPVELFQPTTMRYTAISDGTALYDVADTVLTTTGTTDPTQLRSNVTITTQLLDGGGARTLASFTVASAGLGDVLLDDGDALLGAAGGAIFRVAKSDGTVFAQTPLYPSAQVVMPALAPSRAFYAGLAPDGRLGTLDLDGGVTNLWPDDAPTFTPENALATSDGTSYFEGLAASGPNDLRAAFVTMRAGEAPSIKLCVPDSNLYVATLLAGDDGVYAVTATGSDGWEIVPLPK